MTPRLSALLSTLIAMLLGLTPAWAQDAVNDQDSPRIALVIGLGAYPSPLPTAANDAGLVAQTLAAAGFDVTGARDLGGEALRQAFREFLEKAAAGGPRGVAMVYLAGHAVQFEGENYIVPVDARLQRDTDIPIESVRLADFTRALAATNLGAKIVVIDGAYADGAGPFAGGLALADADQGSLLAFNAAPGRTAAVDQGPYGIYASALVTAMKHGGVPVEEVFARLRVAVNTDSGGSVVPWSASKLVTSFTFFDRSSDAPAAGSAQIPFASLGTRPLRDFTAEQAYDIAIARDTLPAYEEYLTDFPQHPLSRRVKIALAQRREALIWRDVLRAKSAPALWTYLGRYPNGPHAGEAQRRLGRLGSGHAPPQNFAYLGFEVPPPPPDELVFVEPGFRAIDADLPPPPPPPLFLLPPRGPGADLPAPRESERAGLLPLPLALAIPFVRPILAPGLIRPPRRIGGAYRQPRPFGASPNNDRLVPQPSAAAEPTLAPPAPDEPQRPKGALGPGLPAPPNGRRPRPDRPGEAGQRPIPAQAAPDTPHPADTSDPLAARGAGRRRPDVTDEPSAGATPPRRADRRRPQPDGTLPAGARSQEETDGPGRRNRPVPPVILGNPPDERRIAPPLGANGNLPPPAAGSNPRLGGQPRLRPDSSGLPAPRPSARPVGPALQPPGAAGGQLQGLQPNPGGLPRLRQDPQVFQPAARPQIRPDRPALNPEGAAGRQLPALQPNPGALPRLRQEPQAFQPAVRPLIRPDPPAFRSQGAVGGQMPGQQPRFGEPRPMGGNRPGCGNPGQPPCR